MLIVNKTPWNTEGLTALVTAMGDPVGRLETITFVNHQPQPGVKRAEQIIYEGAEPYNYGQEKDESYVTELILQLLTPKRVKTRTSALDRLAFAKDLESYQVLLPVSVIEGIVHTLHTAAKRHVGEDRWDRRQHIQACCKCNKSLPETPIIAGDTRVRTRPPITMERLEQKLHWANQTVIACEQELRAAIESAAKAQARVDNRVKKLEKEQAKRERLAAKAKRFDDRTLSAVAGERPTP